MQMERKKIETWKKQSDDYQQNLNRIFKVDASSGGGGANNDEEEEKVERMKRVKFAGGDGNFR